ncbi:hypothetical protein G9A89_021207 [Geosiphon pyriformis]|nr:hypothetical protein G9A89_021207 [Geosiphon pyriformis]
MSVNTRMFSNKNVLHRIIMFSANGIFRKKWFKNFDSVFTKVSSRFHRLELLVSKIIKASREESSDLINSDMDSNCVHFTLSGIKKSYCASKLAESLAAKEVNIRFAIDRRIKSFKMNKSHTIRSVLKHPFCKMVLNHLVVNDELILEPDLVKFKVDIIMERWTRKRGVIADVSDVATQHILNIASEFFRINDISINNNKTVAIPINSRVSIPSLSINGLPISIAKKGESHQYLGIFLLIEGLLKSSLVKVLCWYSVHLLNSSVHIHVSASDNFLAGMVHILFDCDLFLGGSLANLFSISWWSPYVCCFGQVTVSQFELSVVFLNGRSLFPTCLSVLDSVGSLNILESQDFVSVRNHFLQIGADSLLVYTDRPLNNLGSIGCRTGAAVFFKNIDLGLGVGMSGLMSSTLVELQTIALALECVPPLCSVNLFSDSQSALDACKSKLGLVYSDFCNQCWVKHYYITNVICSKDLKVSWHKIKDHSGVSGNKHTDAIAADDGVFSGNFRRFVHDIYYSVNWFHLSLVWHPDLYITAGFTSRPLANAHTYFMKTLHYWLPVSVWKCFYNRSYPSVLCLYCGNVEALNHVFFCSFWFFHFSLGILQLLSLCVFDSFLFMALYKSFVFNDWFCEVVTIFHDPKVANLKIVKFVHSLSLAFRSDIWSVCVKHYAYIEKNELISLDGLVFISVSGLASGLSAKVVKLLGIADSFGVHFGFHKSCLFFLGISDLVSVYIAA